MSYTSYTFYFTSAGEAVLFTDQPFIVERWDKRSGQLGKGFRNLREQVSATEGLSVSKCLS